jgi:hypothetical protein
VIASHRAGSSKGVGENSRESGTVDRESGQFGVVSSANSVEFSVDQNFVDHFCSGDENLATSGLRFDDPHLEMSSPSWKPIR